MSKPLVLLIDFNNVLYSHYYSAPLTNSKGEHVQAIKGFIMRLKSLREAFNPDYIVICHDVSRTKTFRREMYPLYKSNRKGTDEDVIFQMNATLSLLALMGYSIIGNERYEADDLLGMASRLAEELGMESIIVSADRDLYQLITYNTKIWSFKKGCMIDIPYMFDHYGLKPSQWIDLKILQGDKSDNIPGIEGIGEKTALQLMRGFGSIKDIYNCIDKLSKTLQAKLRAGKEVIPVTRTLVTIVTDYKLVQMTEKTFYRGEIFRDELYRRIGELEIPSIVGPIKYGLLPEHIDTEPDQFLTMNYK